MHTFRYWDVIEGEPFPLPNTDESDPNNPLFYLKRALGWLDELGMKGLIDLHAAPGLPSDILASGFLTSLMDGARISEWL